MASGSFDSNTFVRPAVMARGTGGQAYGVWATTDGGYAVIAENGGGGTGLFADAGGEYPAVFALNGGSGPGLWARSDKGNAVRADASSATAVECKSTSGTGVLASSRSGTGVECDSVSGTGLYANSTSSYGAYIYSELGTTLRAVGGGPAVIEAFAQANGTAITAQSTNGNAGVFTGPVVVIGDFTVVGGAKSAAVAYADGSYHRMYSLECPESWFEDFGSSELREGLARVPIPPDFGELVVNDDYYVFLTPQGDCNGLYVSEKSPAAFEVRECADGKNNIRFDYRIVARRKDIAGGRLSQVAVPAPMEPPSRPTRSSDRPSTARARIPNNIGDARPTNL